VRAAFLAIVAAAILVPTALAGGSVRYSVAAPAIGQGSVKAFTVIGPRASPPLLVKVTNLVQLEQGFGGVAVIEKIRGGSEVFLVMFMGNLSKSPAHTVSLELSTAGTIKAASPGKLCKDFATWKAAFAHTNIAKKGTLILQGLIPNGPDKPNVFLNNMIPSLGGTC
jgi:hypothetical protein